MFLGEIEGHFVMAQSGVGIAQTPTGSALANPEIRAALLPKWSICQISWIQVESKKNKRGAPTAVRAR